MEVIVESAEETPKKSSFKKKAPREDEDTKPIMDGIYDDPPF
jgi:hypothetical protein